MLEPASGRIDVFGAKQILLRQIDVCRAAEKQNGVIEVHLSSDKDEVMFALKNNEYDLVGI